MEIEKLLQLLKPFIGEDEVRRKREQWQLADTKIRTLIEISLRRQLEDELQTTFDGTQVLLEPIPADRAAGPIALGTVHYGESKLHSFGLHPDELLQHLAIFGRTGAGKTNIAFLLLRELSRLGLPCLILDWKQNYRHLLGSPGFERLVIYTLGRDEAPFFFNALVVPPGVFPQEWIKKLIELLQRAFYLGEGVGHLLQETIHRLYHDYGVYEGSGKWPTFEDVYGALRARTVKGREAQWMDSTIRAVSSLRSGAIDQVMNWGAHIPVETLLGQQAVIEMQPLDEDDKSFFIESLLLWIHHYRMSQGDRETLKHVLVIEEAHHILLKKKQELRGSEAITDIILREIRELGEGIVLLDQLPSLISKPAMANTYTTVSCSLKEKGDVVAAGRAMLLDSEQIKHLGRLPVGWAIVKLQGRWVRPFLVSFPLVSVKKGAVTDEQVRDQWVRVMDASLCGRLMADLGNTFVARVRRAVGIDGDAPRIEQSGVAQPTAVDVRSPEITDRERALLDDVNRHAASTVTQRYARIGVSGDTGTRLVRSLKERGLVADAVATARGSRVRLLELTPAGRAALGLPENDTDRRGGAEHRFWAETILHELAAAGITAASEAPLGGGKAVDILATLHGRPVAIEVETGLSDWKGNVQKCVAAGIAEIVVAATQSATLRAIEEWARTAAVDGLRVVHAENASAVVIGMHDEQHDSGDSTAREPESSLAGTDSGSSGHG